MLRSLVLIFFTSAVYCLLFPSEVRGQKKQSALFESDEMITFTLKTDYKMLFDDRGEDPQEQPAMLSYAGEDGEVVEQELKVRLRGNFRKKHCGFPPIRLNFAKKKAKNTLFEGEDKLKLVTHCQDRKSDYQQYVLMEYLAYRMYNQLTDKSFRVRLAEITYEDTEDNRRPVTTYGFLIEDVDAMALRNEGLHLDTEAVHQESTNADQILMLSIFQYMIGNTDWSVPAQHNIRLISSSTGQLPFAVPYDFDFSGLVDANYASPSPKLPIKTVRQRLYRGYCRPAEELSAQLDVFQGKKDQFYELLNDVKSLSKVTRGNASAYLKAFYKTLSSEKRIRRAFDNTCQEW